MNFCKYHKDQFDGIWGITVKNYAFKPIAFFRIKNYKL